MYLDKESKEDHREAKQKTFAKLPKWIITFGYENLLIYGTHIIKTLYISRVTSLF